jgi:hypothetical protein
VYPVIILDQKIIKMSSNSPARKVSHDPRDTMEAPRKVI